MSAKLGTILGIFFIMMTFLLGTDLVMIQFTYSNLDAISVQANYLISKRGFLSSEVQSEFLEKYGVIVKPFEENSEEKSYREGFTYGYVISKKYSPIIFSAQSVNISLKRYAVINIYN